MVLTNERRWKCCTTAPAATLSECSSTANL
jgi:hypothetical protein